MKNQKKSKKSKVVIPVGVYNFDSVIDPQKLIVSNIGTYPIIHTSFKSEGKGFSLGGEKRFILFG
jgi:hypothetical protein